MNKVSVHDTNSKLRLLAHQQLYFLFYILSAHTGECFCGFAFLSEIVSVISYHLTKYLKSLQCEKQTSCCNFSALKSRCISAGPPCTAAGRCLWCFRPPQAVLGKP